MIKTLEEALNYISELEEKNKVLSEELEQLRSRKPSGRKKHDEAWMASFHDFVEQYESGMSIMEIVEQGKISRRTAYRYKAQYDEFKKIEKESALEEDLYNETNTLSEDVVMRQGKRRGR